MSAYVVDDATINRVVTYLQMAAMRHNWQYDFVHMAINEQITKGLGINLTKCDGVIELAEMMHSINVGAVRQRYNDDDEEYPRLSYQPLASSSPTHVYKALRCWLYQCSEGDVTDTPLYKAMNEISAAIAHQIVQNSEIYNEADWG